VSGVLHAYRTAACLYTLALIGRDVAFGIRRIIDVGIKRPTSVVTQAEAGTEPAPTRGHQP
jgi:hypothetical protein